jgi:hypothetical protein
LAVASRGVVQIALAPYNHAAVAFGLPAALRGALPIALAPNNRRSQARGLRR